jgi:hypothetical protein
VIGSTQTLFAPKSVLVFGFSVTASKIGYGPQFKNLLESGCPGTSVDVCGVGGVDIEFAAIAVDQIFRHKKYDIVLLEVLTGQGRATRKSVGHYMEAYRSLISKVASAGALPVVLELYREEIDLKRDNIRYAVFGLNASLGIRSISLFEFMQNLRNLGHPVLKDGVHTTEYGGLRYAERLQDIFTQEVIPNFAPLPPISIPDRFASLAIARSFPPRERYKFSRSGYQIHCVTVQEGSFIDINLPSARQICGVTYLMGPDSGELSVGTPESPRLRIVHAVDQHSYYERIHFSMFDVFRTKVVRISQLGPRRDVRLVKGVFAQGPTKAKIAHLVFERTSDAPSKS